jgi:DNA repair exonuclease SbcCD ATPase subunit
MIRMPQRSVTRFFIPLIDVLMLLFVIFLLMPLSSEEELQRNQETSKNLVEDVDALEREIQALRDQLQRYRALEPKLKELEDLQARLERLEKASKKNLQERVAFHILDIDPKDGSLSYFDAVSEKQPKQPLDTEAAVRELIDRLKRENPGREPYYYFRWPSFNSPYPTLAQQRLYARWFQAVANSLKENAP